MFLCELQVFYSIKNLVDANTHNFCEYKTSRDIVFCLKDTLPGKVSQFTHSMNTPEDIFCVGNFLSLFNCLFEIFRPTREFSLIFSYGDVSITGEAQGPSLFWV